MHLQVEFAQEVTDIYGRRTCYFAQLRTKYFPKSKMIMISQNVSETILTLRWYLVGKIIRN
jgi:DNA primase